jgi:hypothetical protein
MGFPFYLIFFQFSQTIFIATDMNGQKRVYIFILLVISHFAETMSGWCATVGNGERFGEGVGMGFEL